MTIGKKMQGQELRALLLASTMLLSLPALAQVPAPTDLAPAPVTPAVTAPAEPAPQQLAADDMLAPANFGPSSSTIVGQRAAELRDEVLRLRFSVNSNNNEYAVVRNAGAASAIQYHSIVAAIQARLQNGTTRGNPILLRQWDEAEAALTEVNNTLSRLNALSSNSAADASLATFLLESVRSAFQLSGALDEDHVQLNMLRDEVSRQIVLIDRLRTEINDDIQRQTSYLTTERGNLQSLAFGISRGEMFGAGIGNRAVAVPAEPVVGLPSGDASMGGMADARGMASPAMPVGQQPLLPPTSLANGNTPAISANVGAAQSAGRLLVLIRFNQAVVDYERRLYEAVDAALNRRPGAQFTVVAVAPVFGDPAQLASATEQATRNAESVKNSLIAMGMPPARITVSNSNSASARSPEVHVYVR